MYITVYSMASHANLFADDFAVGFMDWVWLDWFLRRKERGVMERSVVFFGETKKVDGWLW